MFPCVFFIHNSVIFLLLFLNELKLFDLFLFGNMFVG